MKKLKIMSLAFALLMVLNMFTVSLFADDTTTDTEAPLDTPTTRLDVTQTDNYAPVLWDEVTNPEGLPYGKWKAGSNTVTYLSDLEFVESNTNNGSATAKDGPYKKSGEGIVIAQTMKYEKGLGTHPVPAKSDKIAFTTIDIWEYTNPDGQYKYDTFHSVVGLTNIGSPGVYFSVYGDKEDGNGLVKLGCSELIKLSNIGEFNIDITGVHKLTLYVTVPDSNDKSASAFADACIFKADPNAVKPDYTVKEDEPADTGSTDDPADSGELVTPDTKAPETKAPETQTPTSDTQAAAAEESGCGGVIGAGLAVVSAVALCGAVATKKRRK